MDLNAEIIRINKERLKAWEEGKALLDESRGQFDGEQQQKWERINAHINELDAQRDNFILAETREREAATLREATLSQFGEPAVQRAAKSEAEQFAAWARGEIRGQAGNIEGENVKNAFTVDLRSGRAAVEADAEAGGAAIGGDAAVVGDEVLIRILGRDAALQGMRHYPDAVLRRHAAPGRADAGTGLHRVGGDDGLGNDSGRAGLRG